MSEIRHNDHATSDPSTPLTESVETDTAKIDTIAIALNKKDIINPELDLKNNVEDTSKLNLTSGSAETSVLSLNKSTDKTRSEMIAPDSAGIVQSIGHQLKSARIARGLSVENVSRQLKISVQQIDAIEQEDFGKLPGRMFLRGFIRNYSNLLQLDSESILKQLPASSTKSSGIATNLKFQSQDMSFTSRKAWSSYEHRYNRGQGLLFKALLIFLFLMIVFGIYQSVNWVQLSASNEENKIDIPLETGAEIGQGAVELDLPLPPPSIFPIQDQMSQLEPMTGMDLIEDNIPSATESPELSDMVTNSVVTESGILHFRFRDESWVAVKDREDEIIFEQLNAAGTEQIIDGKRPLSLVIGNAEEVNLTYNDRAIDLAPYTNKIKGVARFTLE